MKQKKFFIGLASLVAAIGFTACSNDDADYQQRSSTGNVISLTSSMKGMRSTSDPQTTALNTENKVGVFVTSGTSSITNGDNNQHSVESTGALSTSNPMTYPDGSVNIYAYAPYQESWGVNTANTFSVKSDQSTDANYLASDLLYGVPASNPVSATNDPVSLNFTHMLSKINVIITKATGSNVNLANAVVKVINTMPTTTLNPSTGAIGDASGTVAEITASTIAADLTAGDENSKATACAIIVPQELAVGTQFIKITTSDSKTLVGKLGTATEFESGESYNIAISVGNVTEEETEVTLSIGSTSIATWNDNTIGLTAYGVGDYVLADGTCIKASDITSENKAQIAGVIFSTDVSGTDRTAGYNAYAMGVIRIKNRTWGFTDEITAGPTSLADGLADLDGRSKTATVVNNSAYTTYKASNSNHVADLSSATPSLTGANLSGWFVPSFGQVVQILNNLGEANITESTITATSFGTNNSFYIYNNDNSEGKVSPATIINNLNTYVVTNAGKSENVITTGNITIATISESAGSKFWTFALTENGTSWELGAAAGKTPKTDRSVIPCFALTVPAVAE